MNMIKHNHVAAHPDVEFTLRTLRISDKRGVDFIAREIWFP